MEVWRYCLFLLFCVSLCFADELDEGSVDPSANYVFNLPDIVANYKTLGDEVQLEAFGANGVNFSNVFFSLRIIQVQHLII
jgi:hypothetical protein